MRLWPDEVLAIGGALFTLYAVVLTAHDRWERLRGSLNSALARIRSNFALAIGATVAGAALIALACELFFGRR